MIEWFNYALKRPDILLSTILIWTRYNNIFSALYIPTFDEIYIITGHKKYRSFERKIPNEDVIGWAYANAPDFDWSDGRI